jgi:hypothetical protein
MIRPLRAAADTEYRTFKRPFPLTASLPQLPFRWGARPRRARLPPHHRTLGPPRAGRLAVRPTGRTPAAGRLTRWSGLGLRARPQPWASRCERLPRWARGSESRPAVQRERGENGCKRASSEKQAALRLMQPSGTRRGASTLRSENAGVAAPPREAILRHNIDKSLHTLGSTTVAYQYTPLYSG